MAVFRIFLLTCVLHLVGYCSGQIVSNVRLVNPEEYFVKVVQSVMNEVETGNWCNLKVSDYSQNIDETFYGWNVNGVVYYKNGFVNSLQAIDITPNTVQQIWTHSTATDTSTVTVSGTINLINVEIAYDVEFEETNGEKHFYIGTFNHETIQFRFEVSYNIQLDILTTSASILSLSSGSRRLTFAPTDKLNQVLTRQYQSWLATSGVGTWASEHFSPALEHVAKSVIQFPEICYNCSA